MKPLTLALVVASLTLSPVCPAHQDGRLTVREDGSIPELPSNYADLRLHIDLEKVGTSNQFPLILRRRDKEFKLRACALSPVKTKLRSAIRLSGSWYHERGSLPHYILVMLPDPIQPDGARGEIGIEYLLDIESLGLIKIEQITSNGPGSFLRKPILLASLCGPL
jgi:hypothetical protein